MDRDDDASDLAAAFSVGSEFGQSTTGNYSGLNVPRGMTVPTAEIMSLADIIFGFGSTLGGGTAGDSSTMWQSLRPHHASEWSRTDEHGDGSLESGEQPHLNATSLFALARGEAPRSSHSYVSLHQTLEFVLPLRRFNGLAVQPL